MNQPKWKRAVGLTKFYDFDRNPVFIGRFTGKMEKIERKDGTSEVPEFVSEDGELYLIGGSVVTNWVQKENPIDVLCRIKFRGKVDLDGGRSVNDYQIDVASETEA